jgi:hypothetical protein
MQVHLSEPEIVALTGDRRADQDPDGLLRFRNPERCDKR